MKVPMGPPPPRNPNPNPNSIHNPNPDSNPNPNSNSNPDSSSTADLILREDPEINAQDGAHPDETSALLSDADKEVPEKSNPDHPNSSSSSSQTSASAVPYTIPPWSEPPGHPFFLEVLKDGAIVEQFDVSEKGAYMFGRIDLCDFVLEHQTISRFHAVLQFKKDGEAFLYDLGSTHGTSVNKSQVKKRVYTQVNVGDVIRFGQSSRLYIFQGPTELMPPEGDLGKLRNAKIREEMRDCEASLLRARVEASLADGISWGMDEDAIEEAAENDADEVTWQTYKGQLTERQEKTREKIIKRMEKVSNLKKEIDAIRVKDISQGGLTQGQQTQIARNEQRISQVMEELESLEETLNESIQESIGARAGKVVHSKKKGIIEDEDEIVSDDDDFYDRTKKRLSNEKSAEQQSVETADTLLDKKETLINKMEEKKKLLMKEKSKTVPNIESSTAGDELDAYMTGISSQLVLDATEHIQKQLSTLQSELDRIMYLLKIADPMGEAALKRDAKTQASKSSQPNPDIPKQPQPKKKENIIPKKPAIISAPKEETLSIIAEKHVEEGKNSSEDKGSKTPAYSMTKPQWLGAVKDMESKENQLQEAHLDVNESDEFVDYKDRQKALATVDDEQEIEHAAPGLIIRKRKHLKKPGVTVDKAPKMPTLSSGETQNTAADAVALLLKHKRGYFTSDDEGGEENKQSQTGGQSLENSQSKRVFGPSRPAFLDRGPDYEAWVPPEGQTGDGRTSLNDRLGY